jgi:hypothetical protein
MFRYWLLVTGYFSLGLYVVWSARGAYRSPDKYIARWQRILPQKSWAWRLVRGWAAFCVWGGLLILASCIREITPLHFYVGVKPLAITLGIITVVTALLLPKRVSSAPINQRNDKPRTVKSKELVSIRLKEFKAKQDQLQRRRKLKF